MLYQDATKSMQEKFRLRGFCMICNERIDRTEEFEYISTKMGRYTYYNFFHKKCLCDRTIVRRRMAEAVLDD